MTEKVQETAVENKREIKAEEIKNSAMRAAFIKSQEEKNKENIFNVWKKYSTDPKKIVIKAFLDNIMTKVEYKDIFEGDFEVKLIDNIKEVLEYALVDFNKSDIAS